MTKNDDIIEKHNEENNNDNDFVEIELTDCNNIKQKNHKKKKYTQLKYMDSNDSIGEIRNTKDHKFKY